MRKKKKKIKKKNEKTGNKHRYRHYSLPCAVIGRRRRRRAGSVVRVSSVGVKDSSRAAAYVVLLLIFFYRALSLSAFTACEGNIRNKADRRARLHVPHHVACDELWVMLVRVIPERGRTQAPHIVAGPECYH